MDAEEKIHPRFVHFLARRGGWNFARARLHSVRATDAEGCCGPLPLLGVSSPRDFHRAGVTRDPEKGCKRK